MTARCDVCGPLPPPDVHNVCHPTSRRGGCGHPLDDHNPSLKCKVCGNDCGIRVDAPAQPKRPLTLFEVSA